MARGRDLRALLFGLGRFCVRVNADASGGKEASSQFALLWRVRALYHRHEKSRK